MVICATDGSYFMGESQTSRENRTRHSIYILQAESTSDVLLARNLRLYTVPVCGGRYRLLSFHRRIGKILDVVMITYSKVFKTGIATLNIYIIKHIYIYTGIFQNCWFVYFQTYFFMTIMTENCVLN